MTWRWLSGICAFAMFSCWLAVNSTAADDPPPDDRWEIFDKPNLVAWCIVPFDAARRGPVDRATMVKRLGLQRVAYDWREQHVPEFEQEILAYKQHGLQYFAFWSWHPAMEPLVEKHGIRPQFWITCPSPTAATDDEKIAAASRQLSPLVRQAVKLDCRLGLYNHGGWGGEPRNLVAVCKRLRQDEQTDRVGIVYNLHHGHEHIADFAESLAAMQSYLLCLNLNGMNDNAQPKILPIGQGRHDRDLLRMIVASGYAGPLGILDHREELDAEESLRLNLDGLARLVAELKKQP